MILPLPNYMSIHWTMCEIEREGNACERNRAFYEQRVCMQKCSTFSGFGEVKNELGCMIKIGSTAKRLNASHLIMGYKSFGRFHLKINLIGTHLSMHGNVSNIRIFGIFLLYLN